MKLVYANRNNEVFEEEQWGALGRSGSDIIDVLPEEWIPLPNGATLVSLPDTRPVGIDPITGEMAMYPQDVYSVGALLPQGYTRLMIPSYVKTDTTRVLPLFGYTATAWHNGQFYVAAEKTDAPDPWNPQNVDVGVLNASVKEILTKYPENRVYKHLSKCALEYECLTASNTFLRRLEGAVSVSYSCNAACFGCISEQPEESGFPAPQTRMNFKPEIDEIVQIMREQLTAENRIITFGQGCEGEPSTQAKIIIAAMKQIRSETQNGYININTNGGLTDYLRAIVDAGLNLMRVSTISAIDEHYNAYYKPRGYDLKNVEKTIRYATDKGVYTSINYLIFPGVMDRQEELEAMIEFARRSGLRRIQLRNLNVDAEAYMKIVPSPQGEIFGMKQAIQILRDELPQVSIGNYTVVPPKGIA